MTRTYPRPKIIALCSDGATSVEIAAALGMTRNLATSHLYRLKCAGLLWSVGHYRELFYFNSQARAEKRRPEIESMQAQKSDRKRRESCDRANEVSRKKRRDAAAAAGRKPIVYRMGLTPEERKENERAAGRARYLNSVGGILKGRPPAKPKKKKAKVTDPVKLEKRRANQRATSAAKAAAKPPKPVQPPKRPASPALESFKAQAPIIPPGVKIIRHETPPARYAPDPGFVGMFSKVGVGRDVQTGKEW